MCCYHGNSGLGLWWLTPLILALKSTKREVALWYIWLFKSYNWMKNHHCRLLIISHHLNVTWHIVWRFKWWNRTNIILNLVIWKFSFFDFTELMLKIISQCDVMTLMIKTKTSVLTYIISNISYTIIDWLCKNGFLRAIWHHMRSLRCEKKSISSKSYQWSTSI
jgi:hypothetical protein